MNEELLSTLIAALNVSPDNHLLRKQVVQGMIELHKWDQIDQTAQPLKDSEHEAFAHLAMAKAAYALGDTSRAGRLYHEAVRLDSDLVDEKFEAALEPQEPIRVSSEDFESGSSYIMPYNGPKVNFSDVGGMDALKEQIKMNIIYPFQHPEIFAAYGKKIGGGIMLYGPPGCGKTYIARATAGELGANFYFLELSDILNMYLGETEKRLGELFDTARRNSPSVIFIDEVDAIGIKRSETRSSAIRTAVTQLLTEMDGISSNNDQLLVMGATNTPWDVDAAFRRPGRFDRVLFVPPPDAGARAEVLNLHARGRKIDPGINWNAIAEKADHFSGADLSSLIDRACEIALTEAIKHGKMRDVNASDFQKSLKDMRPSTMEWLRRAKNYVTYANQDGFYDDLAQYITTTRI